MNKILNPKTGKMVKKDGAIGKQILQELRNAKLKKLLQNARNNGYNMDYVKAYINSQKNLPSKELLNNSLDSNFAKEYKKQHSTDMLKKPNSDMITVLNYKQGDMFYHGTVKKIDFCTLGAHCPVEPYGFVTDDYEYAKHYARGTGKVLSFTPKRDIKILLLTKKSLLRVVQWLKDTYKEETISDAVARKILVRDQMMRSFKETNFEKKFKLAMKNKYAPEFYKMIKSMKPYEFFGIGERYNLTEGKKMRDSLEHRRNPDFYMKPGGLWVYFYNAYPSKIAPKTRTFYNTHKIPTTPVYLVNGGFARYSTASLDVGMYYYLFKYLKHMKLDGVKTVTKGVVMNNNVRSNKEKQNQNGAMKVEFVIDGKVLQRVDNASVKK